jgi:phosphonoacetaldehyde hydrolase
MDFIFKRSYRGRIKAVILDWAGTAVDYGSFAPAAVFLRLFESRGVTITPADARSGMGLMKKDHLRMIFAQPGVAEAWKNAHGVPVSESDVDALFENFLPMQNAVLVEYAEPIPGFLTALESLREDRIQVGSSTGYLRAMMDVLAPEATRRGYTPDYIICSDEVPAGRPYPWMIYQNAIQLEVYPMEAIVKVGDTLPDVEAGLNAGTWTVGLSLTGNFLGMDRGAYEALPHHQKENIRHKIEAKFYQAGAHFVIDGIWDLPLVIEKINQRLTDGERP